MRVDPSSKHNRRRSTIGSGDWEEGIWIESWRERLWLRESIRWKVLLLRKDVMRYLQRGKVRIDHRLIEVMH